MPGADTRILIPKEHGTYGELLCPLVSALLVARPGKAAWGITGAALGGFLAHEALSVLAGLRGPRALREGRIAAWRSLTLFGTLALAGLVTAWPGLTNQALAAAGLVAALSSVAVLLMWTGLEHTLGGELLAALTLSGWCAPIGLAGGLPLQAAFTLWLIWAGVFGVATCGVRIVVVRTTRRSIAPVAVLGGVLAIASGASVWSLAGAGVVPLVAGATLLPSVALFLILAIAPVHAARLRVIGWVMAGVSLLTLVLVVIILGRAYQPLQSHL